MRISSGTVSNVSQAITDHGANINSAQVTTTDRGKAKHHFEVTIEDAKQLEKIIRAIEKVQGVIRVERVRRRSGFGNEPQSV